MNEIDKDGGFVIPAELQCECERALQMPVYPPQPADTVIVLGCFGMLQSPVLPDEE